MGYSQGMSGLRAATAKLDTVGNNIANSQTVGFKSSSVQFADVYAGAKVGLGVKVAGVLQNFAAGNLETTNRALDLSIAGGGFFRLNQGDQIVYSRNGQMILTPDGYLQNAQGAKLTGFPAGSGVGGQPQIIQVPSDSMEAKATDGMKATLNLDASSPVLNPASFDPADPLTYSYANSATVFDSLGNAHNVTLYFIKTGTNQWSVNAGTNGTVPAGQVAQPVNFTPNGLLNAYAPTNFQFAMTNGADNIDFELDLTGTTQFGNEFDLSSLTQTGYTSGGLVGISVDKSGGIIGTYANEQTRNLGTIALANFRTPEGLKPAGDNAWVETSESGQPLVGAAGVGQLGVIESGVVEASNVDLSQQLVDLVIAQRNYQANAQTIKTQNEVLQQAVNLAN